MLTTNQVNFFEGGSINNGEMVHVTISQYSSLLCPMVNKKIIHKAFELSKSLDSQGVSNNHEAYANKNNT
jgi:hypothetical protein